MLPLSALAARTPPGARIHAPHRTNYFLSYVDMETTFPIVNVIADRNL